jgi:hypothetical protein
LKDKDTRRQKHGRRNPIALFDVVAWPAFETKCKGFLFEADRSCPSKSQNKRIVVQLFLVFSNELNVMHFTSLPRKYI